MSDKKQDFSQTLIDNLKHMVELTPAAQLIKHNPMLEAMKAGEALGQELTHNAKPKTPQGR